MEFEPWYKATGVTLREEVREGRSFNPDEFAIALEQVVAGTAPMDYRQPDKFFARTCFTRALREHTGMVLRRLAGQTSNTSPVLTLVTQFGGGKTHTLTTLYHLANSGADANTFSGVPELLQSTGLPTVPRAKVAVFVGNAWDPQPGRETPWIDVAFQLAGEAGVAALGTARETTPPGTEALGRVFAAANGPVLILFDEVLNFINRHRSLAEPFHAFLQNLTVAMTGFSQGAVMISLPRSQTEMTEWDLAWQERITKVVRRVSKDLIVNDEAEIAEVVRRRLFDDFGTTRTRRQVAKAFADWCFERRAQLPPEWTAVDTAVTEAKAREFLQGRFEACYPFHPATLSVFQRKWQALPQYQQTRGTLAMLAQWISWAYRDGFNRARREPLITLGSAPLEVPDFRSVVLGQLGETRLNAAIEFDIAGAQSHARALDADTKGPLRDIHRRTATAILFESTGGQTEKVAHLPELRFALGEPEVDTTSVDNAAFALEARGYYLRRVGTDGFRVHHQATLKKLVNDRRASLDEDSEIKPNMNKLVSSEFERGRTIPVVTFPADISATPDSPRLTLVVLDPTQEWTGNGGLRQRLAEWTKKRGNSDRLYPGSLIWCVRKPGRELNGRVADWLAWRRVKREIDAGTLSADYDQGETSDVPDEIREAEKEARGEVWASYRYVILADPGESDGLKVIDLGAGHSNQGETLVGRVLAALKSNSLLNESPGAGYLDRKWPPAFKDTGAWPLASLRQAFLSGGLDRLLDPDDYLRRRVPEFVERGDFGLASGQKADSTYDRLWFKELLPPDEVAFDADVYLVRKDKAEALKSGVKRVPVSQTPANPVSTSGSQPEATTTLAQPASTPPTAAALRQLRLFGDIPPESWNRLGTKLIPKLRAGTDLKVGVEFKVSVGADASQTLIAELRQILDDLGLGNQVSIDAGQ